MEALQFQTTISSNEIKIPEELKERIPLHQKVQVLLIPQGEKLYEDWQDNELNQLSSLNDDGE